jgi:hypothetical protein
VAAAVYFRLLDIAPKKRLRAVVRIGDGGAVYRSGFSMRRKLWGAFPEA